VVVEVFPPERAFAEVFAEVRRVGAATAVADHEDEPAFEVGHLNRVGEGLHLGRIEPAQLRGRPGEISGGRQFSAEHAKASWVRAEIRIAKQHYYRNVNRPGGCTIAPYGSRPDSRH